MFESCSRKDICEQFLSDSLLVHSLMWLVWFELSIDRPNTMIVQLAWSKSQLEQQWFFLLSFCIVYAVYGVFYTEQILLYHFESCI